jgi:L-seryl-tRNA(Ser) seleniumtransferase
MVKALELYLHEDHEALWKEWQDRLEYISRQISRVDGVSTSFFVPDMANHVPHMTITWESTRIPLTPKEASQKLADASPSIIIGTGEDRPGLTMNSFMLQPGEHKIVADRLTEVLRGQSGSKT